MKILSIIAGITLALAIAIAGVYVWKRQPGDQAVKKAENQVRSLLRDPNSALFYEVAADPISGAACGYVNAKNGYGGYDGRRMFVLSSDGAFESQPVDDTKEGSSAERLSAIELHLAFYNKASEICPSQFSAFGRELKPRGDRR